MKTIFTVAMLSTLVVLAGCAPSQERFASAREAIRGSEKVRQFALNGCVTKGWRRKSIQDAAVLLDTSEKLAPNLACRRYLEAFRSGRLQYADAVAFKEGRITPELVKIFQGR